MMTHKAKDYSLVAHCPVPRLVTQAAARLRLPAPLKGYQQMAGRTEAARKLITACSVCLSAGFYELHLTKGRRKKGAKGRDANARERASGPCRSAACTHEVIGGGGFNSAREGLRSGFSGNKSEKKELGKWGARG